ncbi:Uncharacterized protein Rs2_28994 [Raphanus sativus]|uniref:Uncharacterized protein LOC130495691 n=1 Tax=Raphanus sativus TaxID=3726 RepID=A0A9W3BV20_RAPSA|nr:uncharacterized protein LOC130495691 [Raphanus sativus]KAJ4889246.1 Uncharacterized protein Rs2_28994 [Raphanus sativus]
MRIYMNCVDPEERRIREARMKMTLDELSRDPLAQRVCLRLESAPVISKERNRSQGRVENPGIQDISESSAGRPIDQTSVMEQTGGNYVNTNEGINAAGIIMEPAKELGEKLHISPQKKETEMERKYRHDLVNPRQQEHGGFVMGSHVTRSGEGDARSRSSKRSNASWVHRSQNKRRETGQYGDESRKGNEEGPLKRKATNDGEATSKVSKKNEGLMVHQKPSNSQ